MQSPTTLLRMKQLALGLMVGGFLVVSIALPLMATDYPVHQGTSDARILSSAAGMGMAAKPILRTRVEDPTGRIFWVQLPSTHISAAGTFLVIDVWCETDAFTSCAARYSASATD